MGLGGGDTGEKGESKVLQELEYCRQTRKELKEKGRQGQCGRTGSGREVERHSNQGTRTKVSKCERAHQGQTQKQYHWSAEQGMVIKKQLELQVTACLEMLCTLSLHCLLCVLP